MERGCGGLGLILSAAMSWSIPLSSWTGENKKRLEENKLEMNNQYFVTNIADESGTVYLVGAGPGDPGLMTVKGLELLRRADVVLHDALANDDLLEQAPRHAPRVYVGKRAGRHALSQSEINDLLYQAARRHATVVRLKGGDPFVFGRGGEELLYLRARGVRVEVVPGVSSAMAVPAALGVPVTHRGLSGSFAVVTGHRAGEADSIDWAALARLDTLVILMGLRNWPSIAAALLAAGRAGATPAMAVRWGTLPEQQAVIGTLATLGERIAAVQLTTPATIVVGDVVGLTQSERTGTHVSIPLTLPARLREWLEVA
jgi:uroporphyrin-III C-methyltransferase